MLVVRSPLLSQSAAAAALAALWQCLETNAWPAPRLRVLSTSDGRVRLSLQIALPDEALKCTATTCTMCEAPCAVPQWCIHQARRPWSCCGHFSLAIHHSRARMARIPSRRGRARSAAATKRGKPSLAQF
jgi:hypothetical protein